LLADGGDVPLDEQAVSAEGARRHLTVLFCDLVNSTAISSHLDPEEWHDLAARFQSAAAQAVTRWGGHVAKFLGDGLMAYFGWPEAHEDDAARAIRAGLAIVDTIAELNQQLNRGNEDKLLVRIGIDSGATVIARGGGAEADVFGDPPTVASRVQAPQSLVRSL
jgi:class 3 adenylate cyclase